MPDLPIAELITDDQFAPELTESIGGYRGTRNYRINTTDETRAFLSLGLPSIGEAWSAAYPDLVAVERSYIYTHGTDDPVAEVNGWGRIRVEFSQGGAVTIPADLPVGYRLTEKKTTSTTVQVPFQVAEDESSLPAFVNVGDDEFLRARAGSLTKNTGGVIYEITTVYSLEQFIATIDALDRLTIKFAFNKEEVRLPNILGTEASKVFAAETLQYQGYTCERMVQGSAQGAATAKVKVTHMLGWYPTGPYAIQMRVDSRGYAVKNTAGDPIRFRARQYESLHFGGIFNAT